MRLRLRFKRNPYRPTTRRQRLVIVALAVLTASVVMAALLAPHVRFLRARLELAHADAPPCAPGQTTGCVGGTMEVIAVPATAPRPARVASPSR